MNRNEFIERIKQRNAQRIRLLEDKGRAYSGDSDPFDNFKRNAEKLGLSKFQIWAVYCGKHLDAIFNAIKQNPKNPIDRTEGMDGRINDTRNYLDLLQGMIDDGPELPDLPEVSPVKSNEEVVNHLVTIFGGNGLSTNQQKELALEFLNNFYGPRHFSL